MTHALSDGAEGKSATSSERGRKFMNVTVYFLDDTSHVFQLQAKNLGQVLFEKVCKFINLVEVDYFGLEFEDDKKTKCWLDALKPLCAQIPTSFPTMHFCVKFYTPDPVQLEDEFTRYLFGLQVKKDLANGFMQCNDNTAAVMVSYIVQADFGDYESERCDDGSYLRAYKFVPVQDTELERKVVENHKRLHGQTPAEADLNLLETARRCELYGIKMTAAKDHEGVALNLAVAHLGVLVFQNSTKINTFSWAKIRKLSFKRRKFLIKLHPEGYGYYKDTVEFFFDGRNECKNFWKKCIENHTFFRCTDAKHGMRQRPKIFSRGSSFRYSGRTQKQVSEYVRENGVKRAPFQRSTSLKTPTSPSRSLGSPASPQPLLPVNNRVSDADVKKDVQKQEDVSPSVQGTPAVTPGDESRDDITYDNISHDSYDILERESLTNTNCMPEPTTNNPDPNTAKDAQPIEAGTNDEETTTNPTNPPDGKSWDEDDGRRRSKRHRVRVFTNPTGQTSPTLYARANRHLSQEGSLKAYPRTVDFVLVNQLPAVGSFSYRDDSVEAKSPGHIELEALRRRKSFPGGVVSSLASVDLLEGLLPLHKSSAMKVVGDNLQPDCIQREDNDNLGVSPKPDCAMKVVADNLGPDCVQRVDENLGVDYAMKVVSDNLGVGPKADYSDNLELDCDQRDKSDCVDDVEENPPDYRNFNYSVPYEAGESSTDYVGSSHYGYNSYKFSQIGRPPEVSPDP